MAPADSGGEAGAKFFAGGGSLKKHLEHDKNCLTCEKRRKTAEKCAVLEEMIGMKKNCFAWTDDPNWLKKLQKESAYYEEVHADNRIAAEWLLYYHEKKKKYHEKYDRILNAYSHILERTGGRGNMPSDITGRKGIKLAEMDAMHKWLELVEEVEQKLPWKKQIFLRLRREYRHARGPKGWTSAIQWKYTQEVAALMGKDPEDTWIENPRTFWVWWREIVDYTVRLAAKRKLLTERNSDTAQKEIDRVI